MSTNGLYAALSSLCVAAVIIICMRLILDSRVQNVTQSSLYIISAMTRSRLSALRNHRSRNVTQCMLILFTYLVRPDTECSYLDSTEFIILHKLF